LAEVISKGIGGCNHTTKGQKISALTTIGNGLFRKDVKPVELTAVLEAAIAAVFEHLKNKTIIYLATCLWSCLRL
jgi:hypothetical protein